MPASILLISSDPALQSSMREVLGPPAYALVLAATPDEALVLAARHDLLVLDSSGYEEAMLEACRRLRLDAAAAAVPLLVIAQTDDVEERVRFLEVGADDVIGRPYDARELEVRAEMLTARFGRAQEEAASQLASTASTDPRPAIHDQRTIAVFSPKGGVGVTTIAVNIAVVAGSRQPHDVLLIDLDLQFGCVAVHLDLSPRQTIVDLMRDEQSLVDPDLFRGYTARHESGLHVLAGTARPEQTELLDVDDLERMLHTSAEAYGTVVVDVGSVLDERTLRILDWADTVILPFQPEIPALKSVHSLLDYLNATGDIVGKSIFVLNNAFARQALRMRDIELALGTKVAIELPYDPLAYLNAANEGIPLVIGAPRSAAAIHVTRLAETILGIQEAEPAPAPEPAKKGFGLFRRS